MSIRSKLAILLLAFLVPLAFAGTASAQAGAACLGTVCGLGGQLRAQIGDGLPLPISIAPAQSGAFTGITIQSVPATAGALPLVGLGLGQPGQVKPTPNATIMQTLGPAPRALTLMSNALQYDRVTAGSIGVFAFNQALFAVQTQLNYGAPHPGTTGSGASVPGVGGSAMFSASGRSGLPTVSFCAGQSGTPGNNFNGNCTAPADALGVNGLARFTRTKNQFGGTSVSRILGTAQVYFNVNGLNLADVPCNGPGCEFQISEVNPPLSGGTVGVAGDVFGASAMNPAFQTPTGVYTGSVGFNGTVLAVGNAVTVAGVGLPFTGQAATSVGFPLTTGLLTISVTSVVGASPEIFVRSGTDARDVNGNGVVAMVTGSMSARSISLGNANRTWVTYEIPEPSVLFSASAGLFVLFGCQHLIRRRSR
jgi:hypothetical protein